MEDNLFSKEQIEQIRKANSKIRANLDLDKYDPKKDTEDLKKLLTVLVIITMPTTKKNFAK